MFLILWHKYYLIAKSLFAAEGLGLKNILPAYRDPYLSDNDLTTGVCFASGGSGLDAITARTTVNFS